MVFQYVPLPMSLSGQNWIREGCLLGLSYREIEAVKEKRHTCISVHVSHTTCSVFH